MNQKLAKLFSYLKKFSPILVGISTIVACIAGFIVIPEVQNLLGLSNNQSDNYIKIKYENMYYTQLLDSSGVILFSSSGITNYLKLNQPAIEIDIDNPSSLRNGESGVIQLSLSVITVTNIPCTCIMLPDLDTYTATSRLQPGGLTIDPSVMGMREEQIINPQSPNNVQWAWSVVSPETKQGKQGLVIDIYIKNKEGKVISGPQIFTIEIEDKSGLPLWLVGLKENIGWGVTIIVGLVGAGIFTIFRKKNSEKKDDDEKEKAREGARQRVISNKNNRSKK